MAAATLSQGIFALDFEYEGVKYTTLDANTVTTATGTSSAAGCNVYGDIVIPEKVYNGSTEYTVTQIGNYSFNGLAGLTSVRLPETITTIGNQAFYKTGLTWAVIPNSVTHAGSMCYGFCDNLEMVVIGNGIKTWGTWVFMNSNNITNIYCLLETAPDWNHSLPAGDNTTLYVPSGSTASYEGNRYWSKFAGHIKEGVDYVIPGEGPVPASSVYLVPDEIADAAALLLRDGSLTWTSSDEEVVLVGDNGTITALDFGRAVVSAVKGDETVASLNVFVCPTLRILYPEGIDVTHRVIHNSQSDVTFTPVSGWKINNVTMDGVDITGMIDASGRLVTDGFITDDVVFHVAVEKADGDSDSVLGTSPVKMLVEGRTLTVTGAGDEDLVTITNMKGDAKVYEWTAKQIPFRESGVFAVDVTDAATQAVSSFRIVIE